ncbi:MAG: flagellar biosynthetic protein FliR [Parvularculaceae bacterium]
MFATFDGRTVDLAELVSFEIVAGVAIFCRFGAMMTAAPGFSDGSVSPRARLAAALAVTAALAPTLAGAYPSFGPAPAMAPLAGLLFTELLIGGFLGLLARAFVSALNVAGQIIALQMGLSLAQIFDPTNQLQGAIVGGFFAIVGVALIFATDLHHGLLLAVKGSYAAFPPGAPVRFDGGVGVDFAAAMVEAVNEGFALGARLAAPFVVFGLVFYAGVGVLNRLIPQAQVFFMLAPANLVLGLALLMTTVGLMMTVFLEEFAAFLAGLRTIGGPL